MSFTDRNDKMLGPTICSTSDKDCEVDAVIIVLNKGNLNGLVYRNKTERRPGTM